MLLKLNKLRSTCRHSQITLTLLRRTWTTRSQFCGTDLQDDPLRTSSFHRGSFSHPSNSNDITIPDRTTNNYSHRGTSFANAYSHLIMKPQLWLPIVEPSTTTTKRHTRPQTATRNSSSPPPITNYSPSHHLICTTHIHQALALLLDNRSLSPPSRGVATESRL